MNYPRFVLLLFFVAILFISGFSEQWLNNYGYVLANKIYGNHLPFTDKANYWLQAAHICQRSRDALEDQPSAIETDVDLIYLIDGCYSRRVAPLYVINESVELAASGFAIGSHVNPVMYNNQELDVITLFGISYLEARLFITDRASSDWIIGVTAKHDTPPPVALEIWVNGAMSATLLYDKGDHSWETLTAQSEAAPGFYDLRIWYVNDFFDPELNLDRNAYIKAVTINR
jgi:hypothetical protein